MQEFRSVQSLLYIYIIPKIIFITCKGLVLAQQVLLCMILIKVAPVLTPSTVGFVFNEAVWLECKPRWTRLKQWH